ncbi:ergothioneine biosynthesis glutamate--cysteine ligase EgtA [Nocardia caishijiensis]|uniref:Glutamate--cysteine ligase EgtA n=1 Tax=Nocardia caishijiensis TaxID=184756 RepID=A0ABQ6YS88_9NOCA|nr:ergothioneine biosynthesis glutamate--cysteine ligase EgtA [Nocardia caishijiensis]KAF0848687.1 glutamate--cysteine ligase [Nocardia caishijiensis]
MAVTLERSSWPDSACDQGGLSSRAAAEAYVGGVCFKLGPPTLIGAELEWLTAGPTGARPTLHQLTSALGPHAPTSLAPASPAFPLPGGSAVTIEPGGQIELSSAPFADPMELTRQLRADAARLRELLATSDITVTAAAADAHRPAERLLRLPRYAAMERAFAGIGPFGALMMCNTAATQVSVDAGADAAQVRARWTALYVLGPALIAAFACSPTLHGIPCGDWASQRMRTWLRLDPARTRPPVSDWAEPITSYARWALDVPLLCVRCTEPEADWSPPPGATFADWLSGALDDEVGRRPTRADLDYHLTTLFPPVRASGHLEVRYLDTQPGESWTTPIHLFDALLSTPEVVAEATALAAPVAGEWATAARCGLLDPQVRRVAVEVLELAADHARTPAAAQELADAAQRCRQARSPVDKLNGTDGPR